MLTYPGFNKVAFELGPIKVHWYGIMYLLGFAAAWWLARRRAAQPGSTWKKNAVDDVIFFAMPGWILRTRAAAPGALGVVPGSLRRVTLSGGVRAAAG